MNEHLTGNNVIMGSTTLRGLARRAGSDRSMSASGSAGSIPGGVVNFHLKIFNLGTKRGGDVHFLIARFLITVLD